MSDTTFGVDLAPTFAQSVKDWWGSVVPLTLGAILTFTVYGVLRWPAQGLLDEDRIAAYIAVDLVGLILAGTVSVPWYRYALAAADGKDIDLTAPFYDVKPFLHQLVASFWFWAAVLLGFRYLFGIPSIFAMLLYAFHGYVIAEGRSKGGMFALGQSVRLTEGRRVGLFAVGGLLMVFNLLAITPLGFEDAPLAVRWIGTGILLAFTTSITLVMGAHIYRAFERNLK